MNSKIDIVVTWVDGSDKKWLEERNKFAGKNEKIDESRYRDWDILRFWFRAVEKYMPWINKVFFVTYGHVPSWLNDKYSKIVIVKHEDYINEEFLPTFNSCVIELNMHKIQGLSDKFIYFNDDMFVNDYMYPDDFFVNGMPCDQANYEWIWKCGKTSTKISYNCAKVIEKNNVNSKTVKKKYTLKDIAKFILRFPKKPLYALKSRHVPTSYLKATFSDVWKKEEKYLNEVCKDRFRTDNDVSQWLMQFWQISKGHYIERKENISKYYEIDSKNIDNNLEEIRSKKYKLICLNDGNSTDNFSSNKEKIVDTFERMYPDKSKFEK